MTDPRLHAIDETSDDRDPVAVMEDQLVVLTDNLIYGYFRDPSKTDAMLRRDGLTRAADQLVQVFGEEWWLKI